MRQIVIVMGSSFLVKFVIMQIGRTPERSIAKQER